ncbi:hypothetical protein SLEP1_g47152 [Rubroshorea leprosula]|uniref:Uncharacterized protein n=1 Tax=Rubroshorea leprosula TaxID=152421 RepID=A0AAV5LQC0_9ROSI|nr:hypothetical protein SLEP1_g47152 [Rubroshorea leprosula]
MIRRIEEWNIEGEEESPKTESQDEGGGEMGGEEIEYNVNYNLILFN